MEPQDAQTRGNGRVRKILFPVLTFVGIAGVGLALSHAGPLRETLTMEGMRSLARTLGWRGPLVVLLLGVVGPSLFLPRWPVAMLGGMLYGVITGTTLALAASVAGAWVQYAVARRLLARSVRGMLKEELAERLRRSRDHAFAILLTVRIVPVSNSTATNLVAASADIPHRVFLGASGLGMIPSTLMYASWGKLLKKPDASFYLLAVLTAVALTILGLTLQRKLLARKPSSSEGASARALSAEPASRRPGENLG